MRPKFKSALAVSAALALLALTGCKATEPYQDAPASAYATARRPT